MGSGFSTAVKHTPVDQNSRGPGFESCRLLGFFLLYPISSTTDLYIKICLAVQIKAKQALYARIEQNLTKEISILNF